jgi:peptide deformylase
VGPDQLPEKSSAELKLERCPRRANAVFPHQTRFSECEEARRRLASPDPECYLQIGMAIREILEYPDPRLRGVAEPVGEVTQEVQKLVDDMAETMYAAPGCGLAAPQIGVSLRVFVVDCAGEDEPSQFHAFINPEILEKDGVQIWNEGCLSFPGVSEEIKRAERIKVRALDRNGKEFVLEADGLLAVAVQHETDHLNGVLMIDKLSAIKKRMLGRKLAKAKQDDARA